MNQDIFPLPVMEGDAYFLTFSGDGHWMAAAGDTGVRIVDPNGRAIHLENLDQKKYREGQKKVDPFAPCTAPIFNKDGTRLAASFWDEIRIWNLADGSCQEKMTNNGTIITRQAFLPDGRLIWSEHGAIQSEAGAILQENSIPWECDFLGCQGDRLILWSVANRGQPVLYEYPAMNKIFLKSGDSESIFLGLNKLYTEEESLIGIFQEGVVRFWNLKDGREEGMAMIKDCAWTPNPILDYRNGLLVHSEEDRLWLWNIKKGENKSLGRIALEKGDEITSLAIQPNMQMIACGTNRKVVTLSIQESLENAR